MGHGASRHSKVRATVSNQGPDLTGRRVGEYEIVAKIGVGGMGAVYEGRQPLIGKRVAVKVLLPSLSNEKELVERFLSEARAVNEIRHRGIVDIFSFGQLPEGAHYFVMEYLEGEPFDRVIKKRAPLPLVEALQWTEETLDALDAAHHAGIIHRDIKPSNLFLVNAARGRPYVKLLDFGIAKLGALPGEATPQTRASVILGTPDYISPEQARGKPISPQTDLYAVGCVLFEMVTGQRVFTGENTLATMWAHVEDAPPVPSTLRPDVPPELDEIILWALEKNPRSRPPSAEAMREALAQLRLALGPGPAMTPRPTTGSGERVLAGHTPPPSVRQRVLAASTPSPSSARQKAFGTPPPKSGGQSAISGRRPSVKGPPPPEKKLAPLAGLPTHEGPATQAVASPQPSSPTRLAPEPKVAGPDSSGEVPDRGAAAERPPTSKLPLVLGGVAGVLLLAVTALVLAPGSPPDVVDENSSKPAPPVVAKPVVVEPPRVEPAQPTVVPSPPVEPTTPAVVAPVAKPNSPPVPAPLPVAEKTPPHPSVEPRKVEPPKPKRVTLEQLQARLAKLEQRLAAREAETGEKDRVLRQFLDQARKDIAAASTDEKRKEAAKFLDEIQGQFPK
jgi:serine/threonine-protein kinase